MFEFVCMTFCIITTAVVQGDTVVNIRKNSLKKTLINFIFVSNGPAFGILGSFGIAGMFGEDLTVGRLLDMVVTVFIMGSIIGVIFGILIHIKTSFESSINTGVKNKEENNNEENSN